MRVKRQARFYLCERIFTRTMVILRTWIRKEVVYYPWQQATRRMGPSRRTDDDKTQFSVPRFLCPEECSKAKVLENYQYTSVPMAIRLKPFYAQLFLLISSVFTEQSQICVKNVKFAMLEQGDLFWQDNLTPLFVPKVRR